MCLLLLYVAADQVLGFTLGVTILKACGFLATFLLFEFKAGLGVVFGVIGQRIHNNF